jgi:hypothetical protein
MGWDIPKELTKAAAESTIHATIDDYAKEIAESINATLASAKESGKISNYPTAKKQGDESGSTIAEIFLDGYYCGKAASVDIRFFHYDQHLSAPEIRPRPLGRSGYCVHGPKRIWDSFADPLDPTFSGYRTVDPHNAPTSIDDIIAVVSGYIHACESVDGRAIDPDAYLEVGGHVHIAVIKSDGVYFVAGYGPPSHL